ncbi:MAG: GNAT family N-acetyltransferase [Aquaticitalea sp.]
MSNDSFTIRPIQPKDNEAIQRVIQTVFVELGLPLVGTAFADEETKQMFESYQGENEIYYILEKKGKILGGAGIKPLRDFEADVCELQKMYFSSEIRGKGLGKAMMIKCLEQAKTYGFKTCYLETIPDLKAAIHLYEAFGFEHIDKALGNTGHYSCDIHMTKLL